MNEEALAHWGAVAQNKNEERIIFSLLSMV
jgi:hypothetical protein